MSLEKIRYLNLCTVLYIYNTFFSFVFWFSNSTLKISAHAINCYMIRYYFNNKLGIEAFILQLELVINKLNAKNPIFLRKKAFLKNFD